MPCRLLFAASRPLRYPMCYLIIQATKSTAYLRYCAKKIISALSSTGRPMVVWVLMPSRTWVVLMLTLAKTNTTTTTTLMVFGEYGMKNFCNFLQKKWMVSSSLFTAHSSLFHLITPTTCPTNMKMCLKAGLSPYTAPFNILIWPCESFLPKHLLCLGLLIQFLCYLPTMPLPKYNFSSIIPPVDILQYLSSSTNQGVNRYPWETNLRNKRILCPQCWAATFRQTVCVFWSKCFFARRAICIQLSQ